MPPCPLTAVRCGSGRPTGLGGNPTLAALDRLARALGTELSVELRPVEPGSAEPPAAAAAPGPPPALVRLARTDRVRRTAAELAAPAGRDPAELTAALLGLLARVGPALQRDLDEADWWRLLDALVLIALHPAARRDPAGAAVVVVVALLASRCTPAGRVAMRCRLPTPG
jgi:hypothetical protein